MNKVFLNGYLASDPKSRITSKGIEQSSFSVGVTDNRNYSESYFFPCVAWSAQAKYININLKKGSFVAIDGHLIRRSYVNNEGRTVYVTEVIVDNIKHYGINNRANNLEQPISNNEMTMEPSIEISKPIAIADVLEDVVSNNNQEEAIDFDWEKELD